MSCSTVFYIFTLVRRKEHVVSDGLLVLWCFLFCFVLSAGRDTSATVVFLKVKAYVFSLFDVSEYVSGRVPTPHGV